MRARYDYILGTNQHLFDLVGIRYIRNYYSDHFDLHARLLQHITRCHARYLWGICSPLISFPIATDLLAEDIKFQVLKALEPPPPPPLLTRLPSTPVDIIGHHQDDLQAHRHLVQPLPL